jgi:hypothetical protein
LKECTCTDFIPKFEHLFDQWESALIDQTMLQSIINRGLAEFSSEHYVSSLITFNCLDQMTAGKTFKNLDFNRALCCYACGDDDQATAYIQREIQLSGNQQAQTFLNSYLKTATKTVSPAQRRANIRGFITDASQKRSVQSYTVPSKLQQTDIPGVLQEKLATATQCLNQGKSPQAARIYRELLSDNMLTGHIALKGKIQELVELIDSATAVRTDSFADTSIKRT